jgi:hypothetical protein
LLANYRNKWLAKKIFLFVYTRICNNLIYKIFLSGEDKVYDVTKYLSDHPGGPEIMLEFAGKFNAVSIY